MLLMKARLKILPRMTDVVVYIVSHLPSLEQRLVLCARRQTHYFADYNYDIEINAHSSHTYVMYKYVMSSDLLNICTVHCIWPPQHFTAFISTVLHTFFGIGTIMEKFSCQCYSALNYIAPLHICSTTAFSWHLHFHESMIQAWLCGCCWWKHDERYCQEWQMLLCTLFHPFAITWSANKHVLLYNAHLITLLIITLNLMHIHHIHMLCAVDRLWTWFRLRTYSTFWPPLHKTAFISTVWHTFLWIGTIMEKFSCPC
jgi:hypothetical protein